MRDYPVVTEEKVRFSDVDVFGHLNNAVFLQFFEQARVAYFEEVALFGGKERGDQNLVVAENLCRYLAEGGYGDLVRCGARFSKLGNKSCVQEYRLEVAGKAIAEGHTVMVYYDFLNRRSEPLPDELKARIREIEARVGRTI
ncbi:MAG TPA: thioesterase family protein [Anaeromyxobacteraceae bacterium]|jgi:YbgC/YbaW family acyl-CoA thioester hydrolase|nr:thioesterase family protein [Anaeromyxobacteraceae bacterium]